MKKSFLFFLLIGKALFGMAQQNEGLRFIETIGQQQIKLNEWMAVGKDGDSINITKLKFYVSNFQIKNKGAVIRQHWPQNILMDINQSITSLQKTTGNFDQLEFLLGIDSVLQESGAQEEALDPLNGMYWTWQSGYIHFKLEGHIRMKDQSEHDIQLHLGGYRYPYNTVQTVSLMLSHDSSSWLLNLDLEELIQMITDKKIFHVMSPGQLAVEMSTILAHSFKAVPAIKK